MRNERNRNEVDRSTGSKSERIIRGHLSRHEWEAARELLLSELRKAPDSHWVLAMISSTYYEERQYDKALEFSDRALARQARCPLALWHRGCALDMLRREEEAINVWKGLLRRGVQRIAFGRCGEGVRWSRSLLNDCRYRIGLAYGEQNDPANAVRYLRAHLRMRAPGIPSLYKRRDAKRALEKYVKIQRMVQAIVATRLSGS